MDSFRIRNFLGKVPFARALRFTVDRQHVTRLTQARPRGFFQLPEQLVENIETRIQSKGPQAQTSLLRMKELLDELAKYVGPKPSYAQAMGALVLNKGLGTQELKDYANALHSLNLRAIRLRAPLLADRSYFVLSAIANNKLAGIDLFLSKSKKPIYANEIALANSMRGPYALHALKTLEAAGLATAIPAEARQMASPYRWISSEKRNTRVTNPSSNPSYQLLLALEQGEKSLSQLTIQKKFGEKTIGTGKISEKTARSSLNNFERQGAVASVERKIPGRHRPARFFRLTEHGRNLVALQAQRDSIHPQMRLLLLGEPLAGLSTEQQRRLEAIANYVKIRRAYEAVPRQLRVARRTIARLSKTFGVSRRFVQHVTQLEHPPWNSQTFQALTRIYLPALRTHKRREAAWFRRYLESNKQKFRQAKTRKIKKDLLAENLFSSNQNLALRMARSEWSRNFSELRQRGHELGSVEQEALLALYKAAEKSRKQTIRNFEAFAAAHIKLALKSMRRGRRRLTTSVDQLAAPYSTSVRNSELAEALLEVIKSLKESQRNKNLFCDLTGIAGRTKLTVREAAKKHGVSVTGAQKIKQRIMKKLRESAKTLLAQKGLQEK